MMELRLLIEQCFDRQCVRLIHCVPYLYDRLAVLTCHDCVSTIQTGVESVPTRYRMTNKPPPTTHNSYVEHILDAFRCVYVCMYIYIFMCVWCVCVLLHGSVQRNDYIYVHIHINLCILNIYLSIYLYI